MGASSRINEIVRSADEGNSGELSLKLPSRGHEEISKKE